MLKKLRKKVFFAIFLAFAIVSLLLMIVICLVQKYTLDDYNHTEMMNAHYYPVHLAESEDADGYSNEPDVWSMVDTAYLSIAFEEDGTSYTVTESMSRFSDIVYNNFDEIIQTILDGDYGEGYFEEYDLRYYMSTGSEGLIARITIIDYLNIIDELCHLIKMFSIIWLISLIIYFIISFYISKWLVRPAKVTWEKHQQFISNVSHELKTPLAVMSANMELLSQKVDASDEDVARYLSDVQAEISAEKEMISGMLLLSQMNEQIEESHYSNVDMSSVISEALLIFEPLAYENEIALDYSIEEELMVNGNREELLRLMCILMDNAIKFSDKNGSIKITAGLFPRNHLIISVANIGKEIKKDQLGRLFDRFYQAERGEGSGLGLAIAKEIVETYRGKISAKSEDGVNTFTVQLHGLSKSNKPKT